MGLQKIKNSLNCYVSDTIETIQKTKQYNDAIKYKFELSLISFVAAGTIMEMFLYSCDGYAISGLIWLLPIYGAYKKEASKPIYHKN